MERHEYATRPKYFKRLSGQFVYGKQNLHKGALGLIPTVFDGYSSSQDIPCFDIAYNVNSLWFLQYFMQVSFYEGLERVASGTGSKRIQPSSLFEEEILTPPLPEQKKIAAILTSVDEVIDATQKQIDKLQDLKKATMNELLTKGIGHTEFKDSELGRIPKSWDVVRFEEVLEKIDAGWSPLCIEVPPNATQWGILKVSAVTRGEFLEVESKTLPANETPRLNIMVRKGDLLLTRANGNADLVGRCVMVISNPSRKLMLSDKILRLVPNENINSEFLLIMFNSDFIRKQIELCWGGSSGQKNIGQADIKSFILALPRIDEQVTIASTIFSIERSIRAAYQKLTQTQSLKKSLMQDLLTGKVRVKVH